MVRYKGRRRERFLTDTEYDRLGQVLDEAAGRRGRSARAVAAIRLLMLTGCRCNEILSLRWEDVDLQAREMRLRDTKTGARVVSLAPAAVNVLAGLPRAPSATWVIPGNKPGAHIRKIQTTWERLRARAGLEDVRLHDLRHSFASRALALGENLPMIGKLLGHSQSRPRHATRIWRVAPCTNPRRASPTASLRISCRHRGDGRLAATARNAECACASGR